MRRSVKSFLLVISLAALGVGVLHPLQSHASDTQTDTTTLAFNVYLGENKTPIGQHYFTVMPRSDDGYKITSRCKFDVNFLFFNAYSYNHQTEEVWQGGCLQRFQSKTIDNGDRTSVKGQKNKQRFTWQVNDGEQKSSTDCMRSFAYWKPAYLMAADKLFNPQTGKIVKVDINKEEVDEDEAPVANAHQKIVIAADEIDIQVFYNHALEWLGLVSKIDGNTLIYERDDTLENSYEDLF